ncbi:uncharacterized protein N7496_009543 [Penicillium cataractarum]|uniref:Uncharacterized protein n=1 Tax=Penicillium cataractarum TaxID=2100454 RepID=A0A9W9RP54_9EURO|nr:uncharacterized protein N7496_009543 [Penicillium cataractarum]KAJ5363830.1 hypothetical protein N7496_009543 [Penicillium cataractarum]
MTFLATETKKKTDKDVIRTRAAETIRLAGEPLNRSGTLSFYEEIILKGIIATECFAGFHSSKTQKQHDKDVIRTRAAEAIRLAGEPLNRSGTLPL